MPNQSQKTYTYRPNSGTWAVVASVFAIMGFALDLLITGYANWHYRRFGEILERGDDAALDAWQAQTETLVAFAESMEDLPILLFVISAIFVGKWIYDSQRNAHALGVNLSCSPALAVISFFIPVVNLIMPFGVMRDMVNGSCQKADVPDFHGVVLVWWSSFVLASLISRIYNRKLDALDAQYGEIDDLSILNDYLTQTADMLTVLQVSPALVIVSAIALITIIRRVSRLHGQMARLNSQ